MLNDPDEEHVDLAAQQRLVRISLWELLLLQLAAALILILDLRWSRHGGLSYVLIPMLITTWVACRLRYYPYFKFINPFTVGMLTTFLSMAAGQLLAQQDYLDAWHNLHFGDAVLQAIILTVGLGLFLGFICVMIADQLIAGVKTIRNWLS